MKSSCPKRISKGNFWAARRAQCTKMVSMVSATTLTQRTPSRFRASPSRSAPYLILFLRCRCFLRQLSKPQEARPLGFAHGERKLSGSVAILAQSILAQDIWFRVSTSVFIIHCHHVVARPSPFGCILGSCMAGCV